jgi:hypothetical protein
MYPWRTAMERTPITRPTNTPASVRARPGDDGLATAATATRGRNDFVGGSLFLLGGTGGGGRLARRAGTDVKPSVGTRRKGPDA